MPTLKSWYCCESHEIALAADNRWSDLALPGSFKSFRAFRLCLFVYLRDFNSLLKPQLRNNTKITRNSPFAVHHLPFLYQCTSAGGAALILHPSSFPCPVPFRLRSGDVSPWSGTWKSPFLNELSAYLTEFRLLKHLSFCSALLVLSTQFLAGSGLIVRRIDAQTTLFQRPIRHKASVRSLHTNEDSIRISRRWTRIRSRLLVFVRVLFREFRGKCFKRLNH